MLENPPKQRQKPTCEPTAERLLPFGPGSVVTSKGIAPPKFVDTALDAELTCVMLNRNSFDCVDVIRFVAPSVNKRLLIMVFVWIAWLMLDDTDGVSA